MTGAQTSAVAEVAPPSSGLDWACRLLFESEGRVVARRRGQAAPVGYERAEAYLALPRAANPRLLVPLGSRQAAATALARNHDATSTKARMGRAALGAGLKVGLTQRIADRVDVFVDPALSPADRPQHLLSEHLRAMFGRADLEMAVILGVPRLNRKPVLQVLAADGTVVGYVKAAWNDLTAALVRNETRVLSHLSAAGPTTFKPPAFVAAGPWGDLELIAASALPNAARPDQAQVFDPPMPVIAEIAELWGRSAGKLADSPYWAGVRERQKAQAGSDVLDRAVDWVERQIGSSEIAFGAWHGDFTPWNMARLPEATYVWDWERAAAAPTGLDLLHFVFQTVCRFEGKVPAAAIDGCSERVAALLPVLDVEPGTLPALWLLYRLELLLRYDEARMAGVLARQSNIHEGLLEMFDRDMEG